MNGHRHGSGFIPAALPGALALILGLVACAPAPGSRPLATAPAAQDAWDLHETPVPAGNWREHHLSRCGHEAPVPADVEALLGTCSELFRDHSGSDAIVELEMGLEQGMDHPLLLLTLGQLYVMAGQGEPDLMPNEGPAADVGDWKRNQRRLLGRARVLLERVRAGRPDDAAIDYLLADALRAGGDPAAADSVAALGRAKCTGGRSFRIMELYQQLNRYPAKYLGGAAPEFPAEALAAGQEGDVVVDLLLDPDARVRQAVVVSSPADALSGAALTALRSGTFTASRIGKYPVWSWLRVTLAFNLAG